MRRLHHPRRLMLAAALVAVMIAVPLITFAQSKPSHDYSAYPPEKRVILEAQDRAIATAQAEPRPPKNPQDPKGAAPAAGGGRPTPNPGNLQRTGAGSGSIIETALAPFSSEQFLAQNRWVENQGPTATVVYAGVDGQDASQGRVMVHVVRDGQTVIDGASVPTPTKHGTVRVVGARGELLTLRALDGTTFAFDVVSRKFVTTG